MIDPIFRPARGKGLRVFAGELRESFLMAMSALKAHKLRSALTLLGILVGVFSIIVVTTTIRAMQKAIEQDLSRLGGQTFVVDKQPALSFERPEGWEKYLRRQNITLAQAKEVSRRATLPLSIGYSMGLASGEMTSAFGKSSPQAALTGESPGSFAAQNWTLHEGRALTEGDVDSARNVCILGEGLAKMLFPRCSALNQEVKFDGASYTVAGTLEAKTSTTAGSQDNFAIIPITTGLNRYGGLRASIKLLVQARNADAYDETVEQVRAILRILRKVPPGADDDFEIMSNDSTMEQINKFTLKVRIGVVLVSSIALLAAGIGIMNIMLVSVTERTREIGVRRAIGAKKRHIMTQFIMEAVVLCEVGGAIGVMLGVAAGNLAAYYLKLPAVLPLSSIALGLGICSLVGVIFGAYPAFKAANLDPIESLRYE